MNPISSALLMALVLLISVAIAANNPATPSVPNPLKETVAALAEKEKRPATDYARMAEQTISFGANPESVSQLNASAKEAPDPQGPWRNLVGDALAGVDEGERLDPKAADWPDLREKLKQMQPPPPPPSQGGSKKDKKDQKKDKKQQQKGSGKDKQQPAGGGQKSDQQEGDQGQEGKGESQQPPSQGQSGKGDKQEGQKDSESGN